MYQNYQSLTIIVFFIRYAQAQSGCQYSQNVMPDRSYDIKSPNYDYGKYPPGSQCRWFGFCPSGYNCRVDCYDIDIPQNQGCTIDRLYISATGDATLTNAEYYCGRGSISVVSVEGKILIVLASSSSSPGGRFRCTLTAQACNCGYKRMNRIVGGQETSPNEYPMMAGLIYNSVGSIKCGATIISNYHLLTAAHCIIGKALSELKVVVGEHDVSSSTDSSATRYFAVASYLVHPQFTASNYDYDIGIIRVSGIITFNAYVGPVCLPFNYVNWDFTGATVILLGWGTLFPGGPSSKVLREVEVTVISQSACQSNVSTVTARQMCTFTARKDACQDDSGGPVLYLQSSTGPLMLIGIISFGRFCASNSPGVNTRITAMLSWITQNAPADYCMK